MLNLYIDGKPIQDLSLDQIGAAIQQIADELSARDTFNCYVNKLDFVASVLRKH